MRFIDGSAIASNAYGVSERRLPRAAYRGSTAILRCMLAAGAMLAGSAARAAPALPTGGSVASGSATISAPSNGALTINQTSNKAIVNWNSFSIGQGGTVTFNNGSGATLNRVTGSASSAINGNLSATGSVYLINKNGVIIGKTGVVKVGGNFVAATLDTSDAQFNAGGSLTLSGNSTATVVNYGKVGSLGGDVALVAKTATNAGTITAPNGAVGVLAGSQVTLNDSTLNDGKFSVDVGGSTDAATNSGTIQAADAELRANGGNVYALAGNTKGVISATGTSSTGGKVFLSAGGGDLSVSGTVTAQNADGSGGQVIARANNIKVPGAIDASATASGKTGGSVSIIGTGNTTVTGHIHAAGSNAAGGTIETSGHTLSIGGADVNAGAGGQWLLDPYDLTVDATAADTIDNSLDGGTSVTLQTTASGTSGPGNANAAGNGDIIINSGFGWTGSSTLTLNAYRNVVINAPLTLSNGTLSITAGSGTNGAIDIGAAIKVTGAGNVKLTASTDTTTVSGKSLLELYFGIGDSLNFGTTNKNATLTINGSSYQLLYKLTDVDSIASLNINGLYALATSLDGTGINWTPIATDSQGYGGVFEGLGNTISDLNVTHGEYSSFVNQYLGQWVGLFTNVTGTVRDLVLTNDTFSVGSGAGSVAAFNYGTIANVYSSANVRSGYNSGGLVGTNYSTGTIVNSIFAGQVGYAYGADGIASENDGTIVNTLSAGIVNSGYPDYAPSNWYNAGFVGYNTGRIVNSYSTTALGGGSPFVGDNTGTITNSYWDTLTGGHASDGSGSTATGMTTAQLQSALPTGFGSAWATGSGAYPYLTSFYPNGIQVVSGTAYIDAGVSPHGGATVNLYAGSSTGLVTSAGANGYFYFALQPGTISASGTPSVVYSSVGADVQTLTGSTSGFDIWGNNSVIAPTAATTLSQANATPLKTQDAALISSATGGNAGAISAINAFTNNAGYLPTGTSFAIDVPQTAGVFVEATNGANITVASPITLSGSSPLTLETTGALAIDAPITIAGNSAVTLDVGYSTAPTSGVAYVQELTFAQGDSIDFGSTDNGATLSIDDTPYKLLYRATDLAGINTASGLSGTYALADSIDLTNYGNWTPIGTNASGTILNGGSGFVSTFEGLGNTISNITVNAPKYAGLFGYARAANIRDINLVGGSVSTVAGQYAGALLGFGYGTIQDVFADVSVHGGIAGGLVGGVGSPINVQGGIVVDSYATGSVTGASATAMLGGLVGYFTSNTPNAGIFNSYAAGSVTGGATQGGLVGEIDYGRILDSYAMGYVGPATRAGGLAGRSLVTAAGFIAQDYFDSTTSGQTTDATNSNAVAASDSALIGTLPSGFDSTVWGTGTGLYPYLKSFFPAAPQVVSGTAYSDLGVTALKGATVGLDAGGKFVAGGTTGANGAYYLTMPAGAIASGTNILAYVSGSAAAVTPATLASATDQTGINLVGNALYATTNATTLSGLDQTLVAIAGTDSAAVSAINSTGLALTTTGLGFTIDKALTASTVVVAAETGRLVVAAPITLTGAGTLTLSATGELAIDAPISVTGAGAVSLQASAVSQISTTGVVFGAGDSINYGSTNNGGTLSIDGVSYSLLYSMSAIQGVSSHLDTNGNVIGNYALATNLNAAGTTYTGSLIAGTPINTQFDGPFNGLFEGLGNTISNLTIDNTSTGSDLPLGLISVVGATGVVSDVRLTNESVTSDWANVGGLVGDDFDGVIQGSSVAGTITGIGRTGTIVGFIDVGGVLQNASASGSATATTSNGQAGGAVGAMKGAAYNDTTSASVNASFYAGGFVGEALGTAVLANDSASGTVTGTTIATATPTYLGGFAGYNGGAMSNDTASGSVGNTSADLRTGGFVGVNYGTITSATASGTTVTGGTQTGGFAGVNNAGTITGSSASDAVAGTTLTGGFIGENMAGSTVSNDSATGTVSGTTFVGGFVGQNDATTVTGSTASGAVSGSINGVGGFAGYNMTGGTLSGDISSGAVTGAAVALAGFAGINYGTVTGDTETGAVGNASATGNIGGLVGHNFGTVTLSSAKGNVQGQNATGGLVGINSGTVTQSFSTGAVTGKTKTGGLIGENDATAKNVYATGATTGTQYVGGLVGWNQGVVDYAYASGAVTGTANVAGFAGNNVNGTGTFLDDYWDLVTTGQVKGVANGSSGVMYIGGTGQPDPTLAATYAGFDFTNIWTITAGNRPVLSGVN